MSATLQEVIARLPELPQEDAGGEGIDHMIFAVKVGGEWAAHSPACTVVVSLYAEEDPPAPPGMDYFLEASTAREVIEAYKRHAGRSHVTPQEAARAVIYYATYDAYLPAAQEEERSGA